MVTSKKRRAMVVANWKMYGTCLQATELVQKILREIDAANLAKLGGSTIPKADIDILICPPAILIPLVSTIIAQTKIVQSNAQTTISQVNVQTNAQNELTEATDSARILGSPYYTDLLVGGQNCYYAAEGAYTGEISPSMLKDFACQYVILGHSERRRLFAESDELIAKKFVATHTAGVKPILCVGESQQERERGATLQVVAAQLQAVLALVRVDAFAEAVIAYEPVWAIGTGLTASPRQAQEVHSFIRQFLAQIDAEIASQVRIIYGGSVKSSNAAELFSQPDIDGGLIGGASLQAEEFVSICKHAAYAQK